MSEQLHQLMEVFFITSPGIWEVAPVVRPDLVDDPMGEYVIRSHKGDLTVRYFAAEPESTELAGVHLENAANAEFIALAHNYLPKLLNQVERMGKLEHEWEQAISEGVMFFGKLTETAATLSRIVPQFNQAIGNSTDQALLAVLNQLVRLALSLQPYLRDGRETSRQVQANRLLEFFYGEDIEAKHGVTQTVSQKNQYRYLFAHNRDQEGLFLVNDPVMGSALTQEIFKAIVKESKAAGLSGKRWHIFAALCPYSGPGIEFYRLPASLLRECQP